MSFSPVFGCEVVEAVIPRKYAVSSPIAAPAPRRQVLSRHRADHAILQQISAIVAMHLVLAVLLGNFKDDLEFDGHAEGKTGHADHEAISQLVAETADARDAIKRARMLLSRGERA
jgi:hypothetical protein